MKRGNEIKKRNFKLSDYNVSDKKYNELKYFCQQYEEKKQELSRNYQMDGIRYDRLSGSRMPGRPTEDRAIRNEQLKRDIELIEDMAKEADSSIYPYIIKSTCYGIPYEHMPVPAGRRQFYEVRRYFFYLLAQRR